MWPEGDFTEFNMLDRVPELKKWWRKNNVSKCFFPNQEPRSSPTPANAKHLASWQETRIPASRTGPLGGRLGREDELGVFFGREGADGLLQEPARPQESVQTWGERLDLRRHASDREGEDGTLVQGCYGGAGCFNNDGQVPAEMDFEGTLGGDLAGELYAGLWN